MATHPSDYALHRSAPETMAHVAACAECQARVAAADEARARFLEGPGPRILAVVLQASRQRSPQRSQHRRRFPLAWALGLPLAVMGALWLFLAPRPRAPDQPAAGIKGAPAGHFEIVVMRDHGTFVLAPDERVRAGDALGFIWRGSPAHVMVLVRDPHGHLLPFFPEAGPAVPIKPDEQLPHSAMVDHQPGPEVIVVKSADHPFGADDDQRTGVETTRLSLQKEP